MCTRVHVYISPVTIFLFIHFIYLFTLSFFFVRSDHSRSSSPSLFLVDRLAHIFDSTGYLSDVNRTHFFLACPCPSYFGRLRPPSLLSECVAVWAWTDIPPFSMCDVTWTGYYFHLFTFYVFIFVLKRPKRKYRLLFVAWTDEQMDKWSVRAIFGSQRAPTHCFDLKWQIRTEAKNDEISTTELFRCSVNETTTFECVRCVCVYRRMHACARSPHCLPESPVDTNSIFVPVLVWPNRECTLNETTLPEGWWNTHAIMIDFVLSAASVASSTLSIIPKSLKCCVRSSFLLFFIENWRNFHFSLRIHSSICDLCHLPSTSLPLSSAPAQKAYLSYVTVMHVRCH